MKFLLLALLFMIAAVFAATDEEQWSDFKVSDNLTTLKC